MAKYHPIVNKVQAKFIFQKGLAKVEYPLPKQYPPNPRNGWNKTFYPYYCNSRKDAPKQGILLHIIFEFYFTPYFYQKISFPILSVPSSLVRLRRIFLSQAQGIEQRNQWWTMVVRSRMDFGVFLLAMVCCSNSKTFPAQLSPSHALSRRYTAAKHCAHS